VITETYIYFPSVFGVSDPSW